MKEREMPQNLVDLIKKVSKLPDEHRLFLMEDIEALTEDIMQRQRTFALIKDALDTLRLDVKYLVFDLTATRRERDKALLG